MTFQTNKYQVIKNAVSYDLANFIFNYFLLKRDAVEFMYKHNINSQSPILGTWADEQIPNTYSCYGDFVMDTLMVKMLQVMKQHAELDLIPTYSYARAYKKGDCLHRHKDRPSCEISTTINLGGAPWPIFIDGTGSNNVIDEHKNIHKPDAPKGTKVLREGGDMRVYSSSEHEPWREQVGDEHGGGVLVH